MSEKYLIVGLGNPGHDYAKTRHNVGFHVVEELARRHDLPTFTSERKALTTDGTIQNERVILAKPQTYMNLSGEAVRSLVDFYKIDLEQIIVIHDDLDLPLGTLRLRVGGGHGGQNGIRSIITHLGTREFARVRFGIGRPPGKMRPRDYVLQKFTSDDAILADQAVSKAADALELWLDEGIERAGSDYNGDINKPPPPPKRTPEEELKLAEEAHEMRPGDPKPLEKMAKLYKHLRRLDDAVRTHLLLAEIHRTEENHRRLLYQWEQAIRIQPELIEVREELARVYEAQENNKKAVSTWLALAEYHEKEGNSLAAGIALEEAVRLNPQHPRVLDLQKKITL